MHLSPARQFIIELNGDYFRYYQGQFSSIKDLNDLEGDAWFVTDLGEMVAGVARVDTAAKYAQLLVSRNLRESGEFAESTEVIVHWARKLGVNRSEVFYTALPSSAYQLYTEQAASCQDNLLICPLYSLLFQVIKRLKSQLPVTLVFRHGRYADVVIASSSHVYYANRCVAFDDSAEQIATLWDTVHFEMENIVRNRRLELKELILVDWFACADRPDWLNDYACHELAAPEVLVGGVNKANSFLPLLNVLALSNSVATFGQKMSYFCRSAFLSLSIGVFFIAALLAGAGLLYSAKTTEMAAAIELAKARLVEFSQLESSPAVAYEDDLAFVASLDRLRQQKSFKAILGDISGSMGEGMVIEQLRANSQQGVMTIDLFGRIDTDFKESYSAFQVLMQHLHQQGYRIISKEFSTEVNKAQFLLTLEQGKGEGR